MILMVVGGRSGVLRVGRRHRCRESSDCGFLWSCLARAMVSTITRNGGALASPSGVGGLPGGPRGSVADLRHLDEVELLGEGVGVEGVAEILGVEPELADAGEEGRKLAEIVAETNDVEGLELQRVAQDLDDQLVVFLREGPRLPGVALLDHGAVEL